MSYLITAENDLDGLRKLLELILKKGQSNGNYLELLSCLLTIHYDSTGLAQFRAFRNQFLSIAGESGEDGWNRATRVYTTMRDRPTKPSYLRRLLEYPDRPRKAKESTFCINQRSTIANELAKKPGFSTLSFVFLRPADLIDKFRPGYVPCPIAGDFKFRDGKLHLSVMFRTSDAFAVGYADIFYLRELQEKVLREAKQLSSSEKIHQGKIGELHLYFSRTYIEKNHKIKDRETKMKRSIETIPLAMKLVEKLSAIRIPGTPH